MAEIASDVARRMLIVAADADAFYIPASSFLAHFLRKASPASHSGQRFKMPLKGKSACIHVSDTMP